MPYFNDKPFIPIDGWNKKKIYTINNFIIDLFVNGLFISNRIGLIAASYSCKLPHTINVLPNSGLKF